MYFNLLVGSKTVETNFRNNNEVFSGGHGRSSPSEGRRPRVYVVEVGRFLPRIPPPK